MIPSVSGVELIVTQPVRCTGTEVHLTVQYGKHNNAVCFFASVTSVSGKKKHTTAKVVVDNTSSGAVEICKSYEWFVSWRLLFVRASVSSMHTTRRAFVRGSVNSIVKIGVWGKRGNSKCRCLGECLIPPWECSGLEEDSWHELFTRTTLKPAVRLRVHCLNFPSFMKQKEVLTASEKRR